MTNSATKIKKHFEANILDGEDCRHKPDAWYILEYIQEFYTLNTEVEARGALDDILHCLDSNPDMKKQVKEDVEALITAARLDEVDNIPQNPYLDENGGLIYKKHRIAQLSTNKDKTL